MTEKHPVVPLTPKVLIFYVEFQEFSHLTRDSSKAEKKINAGTYIQAKQIHKMTTISLKRIKKVSYALSM